MEPHETARIETRMLALTQDSEDKPAITRDLSERSRMMTRAGNFLEKVIDSVDGFAY